MSKGRRLALGRRLVPCRLILASQISRPVSSTKKPQAFRKGLAEMQRSSATLRDEAKTSKKRDPLAFLAKPLGPRILREVTLEARVPPEGFQRCSETSRFAEKKNRQREIREQE